jgi:BASS family bile acid:Na+ symporter
MNTALFSTPTLDSDETNPSASSSSSYSRLDVILSDCTNAFPLWVLAAAMVGALRPSLLQWVNTGSLISFLLATVMLATGMTLQPSDFTSILQDRTTRTLVPVGVLLQYTVMPLAAYAVAYWFFPMNNNNINNAALVLGLLLVGCAPGGTASNLVSLIANANVALSVLLTACSTILATFVTPAWVQFLFARAIHRVAVVARKSATAAATTATAISAGPIHISAKALMGATARVVFVPVMLGMAWNQAFPTATRIVSRFTPFLSVLLVSLICGGVVANNRTTLLVSKHGAALSLSLLWRIWSAVVVLHSLGFGLGYFIPKTLGRYSEQNCRTLSIEVGMQNSALAVVLAKSCFANNSISGSEAVALAALPGALSATTHSCLGSLLAAYWRWRTLVSSSSSSSRQSKIDDGATSVDQTVVDDYDI